MAGTDVLTDAERYELIGEIRLAFAYQRTFWEAVRSGALLGAEEVQDQRLLAAETPPEANPALDVFLFLLLWSVEGPLGASIIGAVQRSVVSGIQRGLRLSGQAYRQLMAMEMGAAKLGLIEARRIAAQRAAAATRAAGVVRRLEQPGSAARLQRIEAAVKAGEQAQKELAETIRSRSLVLPGAWSTMMTAHRDSLRQTARALRGLRQPDIPEYIASFLNVAQQKSVTLPGELPAAGQSGGVTVRAAIEKHALGLIQESYLQQECYEFGIAADGKLTAGRAADVYADIGAPEPVDIGAVIDRYQLLTAAAIWAQLFGTAGNRARRLAEGAARRRTGQRFAGDPVPPGYRGSPWMMSAPEQHRRYLRARFGPPAETWARGNPADVLLPGGAPAATPAEVDGYVAAGNAGEPGRIGRLTGLAADPEEWRLDLVMQWLSAMAEQMPMNLLREM